MKKIFKYLLPSIICFIILGIIYYFNDLYPFGNNALVQVDADYIYIPVLYKIWDFLHYGGNIFYSDIGLGNSIYGSLIIQGSLYSPLNLLLYLVDRDNIVNFFGLFIIIKICLISFTSYIYINYKYRNINYYYKVLLSILYSFSGFIIFNYFNEIWLDIVILFPILVLYLDKLLVDGKELGYIITLSISFIITFYFSIFVVQFIIFYSFIYIYLYKKDNVKETVFKLGKCTIISLLISSFSCIPLIYQILNSSRFNGYMFAYMFTDIRMKSLYLLFSPLFIILFLKLIGNFKRDKKIIYGYIILFILYLIPVIINPINALLHGGNYWGLPYRYGFVTSFILMDASLYYISKYMNKEINGKICYDLIKFMVIVIIGCVGVYLNFYYRNNIITEGVLLDIDKDIYIRIIYMVLVVFFMYIISLFIRNKDFKYISLGIISLYGILLFTSWTIYYNKGYYLCKNAQDLYNNMDIVRDGRYKIEYNNYTPYYGYMYDVNTLDNWVHIVPDGMIDIYKQLGYYMVDTRMYSYGGTIFSDYLLNFKYLFSNADKNNDNMFSYIDNYNNKYLYKINYNNSYGIVFDQIEDIEYVDKFDYQNKIYKNLFNTDKDIINFSDYNSVDEDEVTINYKIDSNGYLYFDSNFYDNIKYLIIDGNYVGSIDNYIKYLGYYTGDVEIIIHFKNKYYKEFQIGFIKKDDIINLVSDVKYKDNKYYVNSESEKYLFIPINNIPGIYVYNNGKKVNTYKYLDNFICINLHKGENVISIKYKLPLFKISLILSVVGLILFIFKNKIIPGRMILNITYWIYILLVLLVFLYYYFYPLFKYVI